MINSIEINRRNWDERAIIHARDITGEYALDRFRAGDDTLHLIEAMELGDIAGKRVLHMQCHIGHDTLSLARRGAIVTGLDFSSHSLAVARQLAAETGLAATFVEGTVDETASLNLGTFDLVYTTWGTLNWLPELRSWAQAIASVLTIGGELYFADEHPNFTIFEEIDGKLVPSYDCDTPKDQPLVFINPTTYTADPTIMTNQTTHEWIHSLSGIFSALIDVGLTITMVREHELLTWRAFPSMVPAGDRLWRLPHGYPKMALSISLRAKKLL
jgi:SAM-dependent methyltransferase